MKYLLLFSYALLPKSIYKPKAVKYNSYLDKEYSLTGLSLLETYAGYLIYKQQKIGKIIILGCHTFGKNTPSDSELMGKYLVKLGVPKGKIIIQSNGTNTAYQVEQAKSILTRFNISRQPPILALTLKCHTERTNQFLKAYKIIAQMLSVEKTILGYKLDKIDPKILVLLDKFVGSKIESKLYHEAKVLLFMQRFDPKGYLQKIITDFRGVHYFDVDILPTIASPKK